MFGNLDDPKQQMLLAMGLGLLGNQSGNIGQDIGKAGLLGLNAYNTGQSRKAKLAEEEQQREMRALQMAQLKKQQEDQAYAAQIAPQFFSPGAPAPQYNDALGDGTQGAIGPAKPPKMDFSGYGMALASRNPQMGMPFIQAGMKDETPINVAPGGSLVTRQGKPIYQAPFKPDAPPAGFTRGPDGKLVIDKEYESFALRKAREGASKVDVKYGGSLASELGKGTAAVMDAGRARAEAAAEAIQTGHQIRAALDSGKVFTGPGATVKLRAAQVSQMLGFGGNPEGVAKTREVIVGLANQTLAARGSLKGQGQISNFEQQTLEKAKAGNIDDMTAAEIKALIDVNERIGRAQIAAHKKNLGQLGKNKAYSEVIPFYDIEEPPQYGAPKQDGVIDFSALPTGGR